MLEHPDGEKNVKQIFKASSCGSTEVGKSQTVPWFSFRRSWLNSSFQWSFQPNKRNHVHQKEGVCRIILELLHWL